MNIPICFYCKHKVKGRLKCAAFEDELIPDEILMGKINHLKPLPLQKNKFVFESEVMFLKVEDAKI